ncbi:hypothetical protein PENTCL1PPCAC_19782, partial [Pristionchus entomophagus]
FQSPPSNLKTSKKWPEYSPSCSPSASPADLASSYHRPTAPPPSSVPVCMVHLSRLSSAAKRAPSGTCSPTPREPCEDRSSFTSPPRKPRSTSSSRTPTDLPRFREPENCSTNRSMIYRTITVPSVILMISCTRFSYDKAR